jgi:hypothetical protein
MDLQAIVLEVLQADTSRALKLDDIVQEVAKRLERDILDTLNDLAKKERIICHVGVKGHPWHYQAKPIKRRV